MAHASNMFALCIAVAVCMTGGVRVEENTDDEVEEVSGQEEGHGTEAWLEQKNKQFLGWWNRQFIFEPNFDNTLSIPFPARCSDSLVEVDEEPEAAQASAVATVTMSSLNKHSAGVYVPGKTLHAFGMLEFRVDFNAGINGSVKIEKSWMQLVAITKDISFYASLSLDINLVMNATFEVSLVLPVIWSVCIKKRHFWSKYTSCGDSSNYVMKKTMEFNHNLRVNANAHARVAVAFWIEAASTISVGLEGAAQVDVSMTGGGAWGRGCYLGFETAIKVKALQAASFWARFFVNAAIGAVNLLPGVCHEKVEPFGLGGFSIGAKLSTQKCPWGSWQDKE